MVEEVAEGALLGGTAPAEAMAHGGFVAASGRQPVVWSMRLANKCACVLIYEGDAIQELSGCADRWASAQAGSGIGFLVRIRSRAQPTQSMRAAAKHTQEREWARIEALERSPRLAERLAWVYKVALQVPSVPSLP